MAEGSRSAADTRGEGRCLGPNTHSVSDCHPQGVAFNVGTFVIVVPMTTSVVELLNDPGHGLTVYGEGQDLRVMAKGLATRLGYSEPGRMLALLREDEQGIMEADTAGGRQRVSYVTLPGLFRSLGLRTPSRIADLATRELVQGFQDWIYREVLPELYRTGVYVAPWAHPAVQAGQDISEAAERIADLALGIPVGKGSGGERVRANIGREVAEIRGIARACRAELWEGAGIRAAVAGRG